MAVCLSVRAVRLSARSSPCFTCCVCSALLLLLCCAAQVEDLIRINNEVEESVHQLELCKFSGHTFRKHMEQIQRVVVVLEQGGYSNVYVRLPRLPALPCFLCPSCYSHSALSTHFISLAV